MDRREKAKRDEPVGAASKGGSASARWGLTAFLGLLFAAIAVALAARCLDGDFLSDDFLYIVNNAYVHGLSIENVLAILDPYGEPTVYTLNYAPVHLLFHATQWELWGDETRGYHVTNAILHGLTAALLVPLFLRSGLPRLAAILGAAFFLVHPANVETVAWIFQLKTIVALALGIGAMMLHERRPGWALTLFTLALLTKITAVFAWPCALVQAWGRQTRGEGGPPRWGWLGAWALVMVAIAFPEMTAFERQADVRIEIHEDGIVHARTVVAIAMRYLVMAATGIGVSTFHETPAAESWLDPWWLGGLVALSLLLWRSLVTLWRGDEEAVYWTFAAAAFAPISQIFPFIFPMGDRYLYTILPGLIGGTLFAARAGVAELARRWPHGFEELGGWAPALGRAATVFGSATILVFAWQSQGRAAVFVDMRSMMVDSSLNYPQGMQAMLLRGHVAADRGDGAAAARAFQRAVELGFSDLAALLEHPSLARVRRHADFQRVLLDLARRDVERLEAHENPTQSELIVLSDAYRVRGQPEKARRALERALELGGPLDATARSLLEEHFDRRS